MKAHALTELQHRLRKCPFCAGSAQLQSCGPVKLPHWRVQCSNYDCGGTTWVMMEPDAATNAWNRRPSGAQ